MRKSAEIWIEKIKLIKLDPMRERERRREGVETAS